MADPMTVKFLDNNYKLDTGNTSVKLPIPKCIKTPSGLILSANDLI